MTLQEQIQEGHNAANNVVELLKEHLDRLKKEKTAIACLKDELYTQLEKLIGKP